MEHVRILRHAEHRRMPWKNGGGETAEVAVYPEDVDLSGFGWRVSMATVAVDGPFSTFPGVDRTLAILSGDGMELDIEGKGRYLLKPDSEPLLFAADTNTFARLSSGTITDLNVMTRRDRFSHCVERALLAAGQRIGTGHDWSLVLALADLELIADDATLRLGALDALLVEGTRGPPLSVADAKGNVYLIGIDRVHP